LERRDEKRTDVTFASLVSQNEGIIYLVRESDGKRKYLPGWTEG
jgi:hypothetical protein